MQNINPERYKAPKSYNANCFNDRLGFAMRDEQTTASSVSPIVINPMGKNIANVLRRTQPSDVDTFFSYSNDAPIIIPGIMSFDFEPVFAPQSGEQKQIVEDIFNNLWSVYRIYYNGADDIQPADLAIRMMCQMLIDTYVQTIRRVLDCIKLSYSANNSYIRNTLFMKALGFTAEHDDMYYRTNYTHWVNFFNDSILGALNANKWIGGVFPGEHRWSSLCTEIYKDESIDSDYVQLYLFKMRSFYKLVTDEVEPGVYAWKLVREDPPTDFAAYLQKVHDFIREVYYDSSALQIQAMLQTISVRGSRNLSQSETHIYELQYDLYPLEGRNLKFTYDWSMLLAIHNANVMYGLRAFDVTQEPATGRVMQTFSFDETSYSYNWFKTPKIVNLPNFGATNQDFINATQWTICGGEDDMLPGRAINPRVLGTDVIVDSRIWSYDEVNNTITQITTNQLITYDTTHFSGTGTWLNGTPIIYYLNQIIQASQFNMHPIMYVAHKEDDDEGFVPRMKGFIAPLEVVYRAEADKLYDIKVAFVNNFWGYPIRLRSEGSYSIPNKITETDAGIGVGTQKSSSEAIG